MKITGVYSYFYLKMCVRQFELINSRYVNNPLLDVLLENTMRIFRSTSGKGLPEGNEALERELSVSFRTGGTAHSGKKLLSIVRKLKEQLSPVDYLFFKAVFTEDDRETEFLLRQAQHLEPENVWLQILAGRQREYLGDDTGALVEQLNFLASLSGVKEIKNYCGVIRILFVIREVPDELKPAEVAEFLNGIEAPELVIHTILYHFLKEANVQQASELFQHIEMPGKEAFWMYRLAKAAQCVEADEFADALRWFEGVDIYSRAGDPFLCMDMNHKKAVALIKTGNEAQAIEVMLSFLLNRRFRYIFSAGKQLSIICVARFYVDNCQFTEAERILSLSKDRYLDVMHVELQEEYMLLWAKCYLHHGDMKSALSSCRQAYTLRQNPEIGAWVDLLES